MGAIDIHTHAFPDDIAGRAISMLESECPWKAFGKGTISDLVASMDAADIDVSVVCMIATKPDQVKKIFDWCRKVRSDRIEPLPSIHPDASSPDQWMARIAKEGFAGIKLHPMYQDFAADEPRLDPIYAAAAEAGLLVEVHCGRDIAFPPDDDRAAPARFRRVIDRFPKLQLLCTHMGGWQMWEESSRLIVGQDVYLETSFSLGDRGTTGDRIAELVRRHGAERVLFGSDWPWAPQKRERQAVEALPLDESDRRKILWSNAARLLEY